MRFVCDTNVFVSGVFFSGAPLEILRAWRLGQLELVVSPDILEEYQRVGERLAGNFPEVSFESVFRQVALRAIVVDAPPLVEQVCTDRDDDKFLACALASGTKIIVTGDKALLRVSGYRGILIVRARNFLEEYLRRKN